MTVTYDPIESVATPRRRGHRKLIGGGGVFVVAGLGALASFIVLQGLGLFGGVAGILGEAQSDSPLWVTILFLSLFVLSGVGLVVALVGFVQMTVRGAKAVAGSSATQSAIGSVRSGSRRARDAAVAGSRSTRRRVSELGSRGRRDPQLSIVAPPPPPAQVAAARPEVVAGWYRDPYEHATWRWHDGSAWTEHVA